MKKYIENSESLKILRREGASRDPPDPASTALSILSLRGVRLLRPHQMPLRTLSCVPSHPWNSLVRPFSRLCSQSRRCVGCRASGSALSPLGDALTAPAPLAPPRAPPPFAAPPALRSRGSAPSCSSALDPAAPRTWGRAHWELAWRVAPCEAPGPAEP